MKNPEIGSNLEQSFFDFFTTEATVRFGLENTRLFLERLGKKYNIDAKLVHQLFNGSVNLSNDLTHYDDFTVSEELEIVLEDNPIIGGSAEIRLIGDGSTTPTFTGFTVSTGSAAYDPTLDAINKVVFYFDGTEVFYSITILAAL